MTSDIEIRNSDQTIYLPVENTSVRVYERDTTIISSGDKFSVSTDTETQLAFSANVLSSGDNAEFDIVTTDCIVHSSGSAASLVADADVDDGKLIDGAGFYFSGDEAQAVFKGEVQKAVVVMGGRDSKINDLSDPYDVNKMFIIEDDSSAYSASPANMIISTGNNSEVGMGSFIEDYPATRPGIIFVGGENNRVTVGEKAVGYCAAKPEYIEFLKGSAAAINWNDGTRERISVFYEGENGIEAGVKYIMNTRGQLIQH